MPLRQTNKADINSKNSVDIAFLIASGNSNTFNNSLEDIEKELNMITKEDLSARHDRDSSLQAGL